MAGTAGISMMEVAACDWKGNGGAGSSTCGDEGVISAAGGSRARVSGITLGGRSTGGPSRLRTSRSPPRPGRGANPSRRDKPASGKPPSPADTLPPEAMGCDSARPESRVGGEADRSGELSHSSSPARRSTGRGPGTNATDTTVAAVGGGRTPILAGIPVPTGSEVATAGCGGASTATASESRGDEAPDMTARGDRASGALAKRGVEASKAALRGGEAPTRVPLLAARGATGDVCGGTVSASRWTTYEPIPAPFVPVLPVLSLKMTGV